MNDTFNTKDVEHRNLVAKLRNSIADLNFYAYRFLILARLQSTPRTGIVDAMKYSGGKSPPPNWPEQLNDIFTQYEKILNATPKTADAIFRETWVFVHDFDHIFKHGRF